MTVKTILERYALGMEVRVFGSRIAGRAKPYSDLDLALERNIAGVSKDHRPELCCDLENRGLLIGLRCWVLGFRPVPTESGEILPFFGLRPAQTTL